MEQIQPDYRAFDAYQRMEALRQCGVGALLHDIGKAFVRRRYSTRDGPLTAIEWEVMKRHPLNGLAVLLESDLPVVRSASRVASSRRFSWGRLSMGLEGLRISTLLGAPRIIDCFVRVMTSRGRQRPHIPFEGDADYGWHAAG